MNIPEIVFSIIEPAGRREATMASFRQIAALPGAQGVDLYALLAAMAYLGVSQHGDAPPVQARRRTCAEIGAGAYKARMLHGKVDIREAAPWFQAQIDAWSKSEDPRQAAMAATAERELAEIMRQSS